jgi:hypothetical protein
MLLAALPAFSQGMEKHWYLDVHRFTPSLSGHYYDTSSGNPISLDLKDDLGLDRDSAKAGFGLEYQGPRFGLELARDAQDYSGQKQLTRNITINGQTFTANTVVTSALKTTTYSLNWTIRYLAWPAFWLGLDLGGEAIETKIDASGVVPVTQLAASADYKTTLPAPQIGPSLGFVAADGKLVGRAMVHYLAYKGATYTHAGADLRFFPISWLGVRVFADSERFKVPKDSLKSDLDVGLDRSGAGVGIVARF